MAVSLTGLQERPRLPGSRALRFARCAGGASAKALAKTGRRKTRCRLATGLALRDVERGARGSRHVHCAALLRELTGAEDALVVNNCAAALVLTRLPTRQPPLQHHGAPIVEARRGQTGPHHGGFGTAQQSRGAGALETAGNGLGHTIPKGGDGTCSGRP